MNKIYFGGGECTIEGTDIVGLQIEIKYPLEITKTCGDDCLFRAGNNIIIIVSLNRSPLNNLFTYAGEMRIKSIIASDSNGKKVRCSSKRVMDYSELLDSKSEDMTEIKSEDLNAGYKHKRRVSKTTVKNNILKNQNSKGNLYLNNGTAYTGSFHVHMNTGKFMTGGEHTESSQNLYIKSKTGKLR